MALAAARRTPRVVVVAIAAAWALALTVHASGDARRLHHDWLVDGGVPLVAAVAMFLIAWQVHVAAMMLPSSLPLIVLFERASSSQPAHGRARAAFLGGYALVWTAFGAVAFVADVVLHEIVHRSAWLDERRWLLAGAVLAVAGAFQFSDAKDRCLHQCRNPAAFLLRHYERGVGGAFRMGRRHGLFCLGCCWALMFVMFAVGIANLAFMAPLAVLMYFEKTARHGDAMTRATGVLLLAGAAVVFAHPGWLPQALGG